MMQTKNLLSEEFGCQRLQYILVKVQGWGTSKKSERCWISWKREPWHHSAANSINSGRKLLTYSSTSTASLQSVAACIGYSSESCLMHHKIV